MLGAVALLALGVAGTASAAYLNYEGTLTIQLGDFPTIPAISQGVAKINNSGGGSHVITLELKASNGGIVGGGMVPITDPKVKSNGIASVRIDATMGSGALAPISGNAASSVATLTQNTLPIKGVTKICLLTTSCTDFLSLSHTQNNGAKGVGIGGLLTIGGTNPIRISIEAAPWTIKTGTSLDEISTVPSNMVKVFTNINSAGFVHTPASNDGATASSTATPNGVVQLISPMQVVTNLTAGSSKKIALFARMGIRFIPEPGMLLLLGSGVAGLVLLGRHRMRK
jgi:hypothetical protein